MFRASAISSEMRALFTINARRTMMASMMKGGDSSRLKSPRRNLANYFFTVRKAGGTGAPAK